MNATGHYGVDLAALKATADGLQSIMDQMRELGVHGEETTGSALEDLALSTTDVYDAEVQRTLADYLERMHYSTRTMLTHTDEMVGNLQDTRTAYQKAEDGAADFFGKVGHTIGGNPLEEAP